MGDASLNRRFGGQARLARLLLWRIGDSTDIGECLDAAEDSGMITDDDRAFLITCLDDEERARESSYSPEALDVDEGMLERLIRCADKLNRADSA